MTLDPPDVQLDGAQKAAIGRIEVCNRNNDNFRLKGIRIWGDSINDDGSTTYIPNGDSRHLPNYDRWSSSKTCPIGKFATGLVLHATQSRNNRAQVTGLQLICRSIGT